MVQLLHADQRKWTVQLRLPWQRQTISPQSRLQYSLILSCLCIRSTFLSLYWAWMVLQWPINSTNSLDKTPCWRRGDTQGQLYCTFNIQINLPVCVELSSLDRTAMNENLRSKRCGDWKRTCVRCIRTFMGTYVPSSSPFLNSMPSEKWLMSYNKFKPNKKNTWSQWKLTL